MSETTITIIVKYCLSSNATEVKEVSLDSLDISLFDVCKMAAPESTIFTFDRYYGKSAVMFEYQMLPYILVNKEYYEWNIPYSQVRIDDFISTHDINSWTPLYVEVNNAGGSGLFGAIYQSWSALKPVLDEIGRFLMLKDIILFVYKSFGKDKYKKPTQEEFYRFIVSKNQWDLQELSYRLSCDDEILKNLLLAYGFEEHEGRYWKNEYKVQKYIDTVESIRIKELYDNHGTTVNCYALNEIVCAINNDLAYMYVLNDMKKSDDEILAVTDMINMTITKSKDYYAYNSIEHKLMALAPFNSSFDSEKEESIYRLFYDLREFISETIQTLENDIMV